jgi:hypothetical protein
VPAYKTREANTRPVFGNAGLSSYMQIKKYVELTDEQIEAILHASPQSFEPDVHEVMRAYPLVTLTRMAEIAATYIN